MSDLMLDVDQAGELKAAARRAGATNADLKKLSEGDMLARLLPLIRSNLPATTPIAVNKSRFGRVEVKHIINLDAEPYIPGGWSYDKKDQLPKRARGGFIWDATKLNLHLSPNQQGGKVITGNELQKELKCGKHTVLGANVLDYLLENPHLIPDSWKGKAVFFWGTIYRDANDNLVVRYLCWGGGRWFSYGYGLDNGWDEANPALVRAS